MSRFKTTHKRSRSAGSYDLNPEEPTYTLKYLGCCKLERKFSGSNGQLCSEESIQTIINEPKNKPKKVIVNISTNIQRGLTIREPLSSYDESFQLHTIAYCCSSSKNARVCSFIVDRGLVHGQDLECHAFMCDKETRAREICVQLSNAFQIAYQNWKLQKRRIETLSQVASADSDSYISRKYSTASVDARIVETLEVERDKNTVHVHHEEDEYSDDDADTPLLVNHKPVSIVAK